MLYSRGVGVLLLLCAVACSALAEEVQECSAGSILGLLSADLRDYERVQTDASGRSTQGGSSEYYYSDLGLRAVNAVYFGETGKLEFEYRFESSTTYAATVTRYYYATSIYSDEEFQITAVQKSDFAVCDGELIRGRFDQEVVDHFERSSAVLRAILENAPR